jgi:enoyl-CoA hydratase/carnithine racemase
MYKNFVLDSDAEIVVVTLNRPEKRNPIDEEMLSEFDHIEAEDNVYCSAAGTFLNTSASEVFSACADPVPLPPSGRLGQTQGRGADGVVAVSQN